MSLNKKGRSMSNEYGPRRDRGHYFPQDYAGWPTHAQEGSVKYSSWKQFKKAHPFNAELLIYLFGERDAIECHRSMSIVSEPKAASLCSFFSRPKVPRRRIKNMGDC
jgi:hypothetical protein